jgi:hypothetical protein
MDMRAHDIFAIGVTVFLMMVGDFPYFYDRTETFKSYARKINGRLHFPAGVPIAGELHR